MSQNLWAPVSHRKLEPRQSWLSRTKRQPPHTGVPSIWTLPCLQGRPYLENVLATPSCGHRKLQSVPPSRGGSFIPFPGRASEAGLSRGGRWRSQRLRGRQGDMKMARRLQCKTPADPAALGERVCAESRATYRARAEARRRGLGRAPQGLPAPPRGRITRAGPARPWAPPPAAASGATKRGSPPRRASPASGPWDAPRAVSVLHPRHAAGLAHPEAALSFLRPSA